MKILFIQTKSYTSNKSGVPRVTYNLGKYFTEQGMLVAYFSFQNKGHIRAEYGKLYKANSTGLEKNKQNFKDLESAIKEFCPIIVINQMPYVQSIALFLQTLKQRQDFKLIACIHNSLFNFKSNVKDIIRRKYNKPIANIMATKLFSNIPLFYHKKKHRKQLISILDLHDVTLLLTPANYIELQYFVEDKILKKQQVKYIANPAIGIKNQVAPKEKTILHVGSINIPQKRSDLLLDFWENIYKELPDWDFKILGDGDYLDTLKEDLKNRNLPRVHLLGFQKSEPYFEKASIFMMPSAYEGFPNTILEAHSYGCPVIAFNSYLALEWIVGKQNKELIANPFDVASLSQRCLSLAKDKAYLSQMQKQALENVNRFSLVKIGQEWKKLFKEILE